MKTTINKVCILDCIGFDLQQQSHPMQVRFAKCIVHEDGRVERQWSNNALLCHRVTIKQGEDIDARMEMECEQMMKMGYDPPPPRMIERIKAHCAIEWDGEIVPEWPMLHAPEERLEPVPFTMAERELAW